MERRMYLQIPGPTNIPDRILRSLAAPLINHRGPEFEELLAGCIKGVQEVFGTENEIMLFPSSGSGALESVIVNLLSPGDTLAVVSLGVFSERVAVIAEKYGMNVIRIAKEWGQAVKPEDILSVLEEDKEQKIKLVCLPHNETATGITNNIEEIAMRMRDHEHPALLSVDAISSMAMLPLKMDDWGVDIVVSASQKGFMLPPGLSMVALNEKAWKLSDAATSPKWYWNYEAVKEKIADGQLPYTPPTSLLYGLRESLMILNEEGLQNVWDRHTLLAEAMRNAMKAMGLQLFAEKGYESDALTTVHLPDGIQYKAFADVLKNRFGLVIGGGLQKLAGKIFRVGHMGSIHALELYAIAGGIEMGLLELGYPVEPGTAAKAVTETLLNKN